MVSIVVYKTETTQHNDYTGDIKYFQWGVEKLG